MNTRQDFSASDDALRDLLAAADLEQLEPRPEFVERLRAMPEQLKGEHAITPAPRAGHGQLLPRQGRWSRRVALLGLIMLCLITAMFWGQPQPVLGNVLAALRAEPWVHIQMKSIKGTDESLETWHSPLSFAVKGKDYLSYLDRETGIVTLYYPDKGSGIRRKAGWSDRPFDFESLATLVSPNREQVKELDRLKVLRVELQPLDDQKTRHTITLAPPQESFSPDTHIIITVIASTKTSRPELAQLNVTQTHEGNTHEIVKEFVFRYPESGPNSIQDLGAPAAAPVQDRTNPQTDPLYQEVMIAMERGRQGLMTKYIAYYGEDTDKPRQIETRLGQRVRQDSLTGRFNTPSAAGMEPPMFDVSHWKQMPRSNLIPQSLFDGSGNYYFGKEQWVHLNNPASFGPEVAQDVSLGTIVALAYPYLREDPTRSMSIFRDEATGLVVAEQQALLDVPDPYFHRTTRYWLDPKFGYAVVKQELRDSSATEEEFRSAPPGNRKDPTTLVGGYRQSPSGAWYPTCFRRVGALSYPNAKSNSVGKAVTNDPWNFIEIDFEADVPESLFDPQRSPFNR